MALTWPGLHCVQQLQTVRNKHTDSLNACVEKLENMNKIMTVDIDVIGRVEQFPLLEDPCIQTRTA